MRFAAGVGVLKDKLKFLRKNLSGVANLKIMGEKPDKAFMQAVLARGDRRLANGLVKYVTGGGNWIHIFRKEGINPDKKASRFIRRRFTSPTVIPAKSLP